MDVVCTAGHVDHGKSTLVRALTGMEPDRFAEERRRGLTIDIGFGWSQLGPPGNQRTVAFVDLPGHERFIANMLAGAGPVEAALFVVAADEGWSRQSQEHLDILDLLEVSTGVVALTKADAVDPEGLATIRSDITSRLTGTSLGDAPIVAVSATTGAGLDELQTALVDQLQRRPLPADLSRPRLWVDRVFTIKGAGTVVTGTLTGGALAQGDDVTVLPGRISARVRGLQSLKTAVATAGPGERVAVNLTGIERSDVARGDVVAAAGAHLLAATIDVRLRTLPDERVGRRGAWHVHIGSGEWLAQVRPAAGSPISGEGHARLILGSPAPVVPGDRFVLRDAGRQRTVGGGIILDIAPVTASRPDPAALARRADALRGDDRVGLLALHVAQHGAVALETAAAAVGLPAASAAAAARQAGLLMLGPGVADPAAAARWSGAVVAALQTHHRSHPIERAAPRGTALQAAVEAGCPADLAPALLDVLIRLGRVMSEGVGVRHPDHTVRLAPAQQQARTRLVTALEHELFAPPNLTVAARDAGASMALVRELEADGTLVRISADIAVSGRALGEAQRRLREAFDAEGPLTTARAKEILATTRKYAVPLLELMDQRGMTRRRGDVRDVL